MGLLMLKLRTVELESRAEQTSDCKLVYILGKKCPRHGSGQLPPTNS